MEGAGGKLVGRISFSVAGAFVTRAAREWFWDEHKPWAVVEEFLLSCMKGTDQTDEELKELAHDVVFGRAKFIGNTRDGDYRLVDDDQDLVVHNVGRLAHRLSEAERDLKEIQDKYLDLCYRLEDEGYDWLIDPQPKSVASSLVTSFLEQVKIEEKYEDNYGWLEPDGTFHAVEWGRHDGWAADAIKARGWMDEYARSEFGGLYGRGDFLVGIKGWVLIHNPGLGVAQVTKSDTRPLTKAQREFLFDYYTDRGKNEIAQKYLEEE